jgi:hypothetical protein
MLLVMPFQNAPEYDRYHNRRLAGYNRKSSNPPAFAGFASMAIGG